MGRSAVMVVNSETVRDVSKSSKMLSCLQLYRLFAREKGQQLRTCLRDSGLWPQSPHVLLVTLLILLRYDPQGKVSVQALWSHRKVASERP